MFRLVVLSLCLALGFAFAPLTTRTTTRLPLALSTPASLLEDDDLYFRQMLSKARECAYSDTASALDAQRFLSEILHLESGCVSGNLSGDVCENVDDVADIVAHLRVKADKSSTPGILPNKVSPLMASILFIAGVILLRSSVINMNAAHEPFTIQEWVWAARGGYLPNMVHHFIRNGGL